MAPPMPDLGAGVPPQPAGSSSPTQSSKAAVHSLAWPGLAWLLCDTGAHSGWDLTDVGCFVGGIQTSAPGCNHRNMVLALSATPDMN